MKPDRSEEISRPRVQDTYIEDWSPVPSSRYQGAQAAEKAWWSEQNPLLLMREAQYRFYAGHYEWIEHRALLNPLGVNSSRPANFQIPGEAIDGKTFLDIGCGPVPEILSLVHCAQVHVVDPLIGFFKQIQPFGWESFSSVSVSGAEQLSFEDQSVGFVLCRNTWTTPKTRAMCFGRLRECCGPTVSFCWIAICESGAAAAPLIRISGVWRLSRRGSSQTSNR